MLHGLAIIISSWIIPFERLHYLIIIVLGVSVLLSDKSPNAMLAWIFTIFTFPLGGAVLYLLFGINWRGKKKSCIQGFLILCSGMYRIFLDHRTFFIIIVLKMWMETQIK